MFFFQLRLTALTPSEVESYGGKPTALLEFDVSGATQPSPDAKPGDPKNVVQSSSSVSVVLSPPPTDEHSLDSQSTEQLNDDKRLAYD